MSLVDVTLNDGLAVQFVLTDERQVEWLQQFSWVIAIEGGHDIRMIRFRIKEGERGADTLHFTGRS